MSNFEFFDEPYPQTGPVEMDPVLRSQIIAYAEDGLCLDELGEIFGPKNVELAATNNITLAELIEGSGGNGHAA
jgi:hypothetical protein